MKWWKKWSYLGIWMMCGVLIMTATDSWAAVREPGHKAREWVLRMMGEGTGPGSEGWEDSGPGTPGSAEDRNSQEGEGFGDGQTQAYETTAGSEGQEIQETQNGEDAEGQGDGNQPGAGSQEGSVSPEGQGGETPPGTGGSEGPEGQGDGNQPGAGSQEGSVSPEGQGGETPPGTGGPEGSGGQEPEVAYRNPEDVVYTTVEDDYFADAVFIGDSRMVGMYEYGELTETGTFYVSKGMTIFRLLDAQIVEVEGQTEKITVEQALSERQFAKIYLEVGINEMGTGDLERFLNSYQEVLNRIRELQPEAIIYVQSIMKVTTARSNQGDYINNEGIEARNAGLAALADNVKTYYLDVNPLVTDDTGGLNPDYTFDGVHLKGKDVLIWKNFLKEHAISLD